MSVWVHQWAVVLECEEIRSFTCVSLYLFACSPLPLLFCLSVPLFMQVPHQSILGRRCHHRDRLGHNTSNHDRNPIHHRHGGLRSDPVCGHCGKRNGKDIL